MFLEFQFFLCLCNIILITHNNTVLMFSSDTYKRTIWANKYESHIKFKSYTHLLFVKGYNLTRGLIDKHKNQEGILLHAERILLWSWGYLAWFKLPVVDDTSWDDGRVVPVACAAVILACVVTLSGFTRHAPYKTNVPEYSQTMKQKGRMLLRFI